MIRLVLREWPSLQLNSTTVLTASEQPTTILSSHLRTKKSIISVAGLGTDHTIGQRDCSAEAKYTDSFLHQAGEPEICQRHSTLLQYGICNVRSASVSK